MSAPKSGTLLAITLVASALVVVVLLLFVYERSSDQVSGQKRSLTVSGAKTPYTVFVPVSSAAQEKGLGYIDAIPNDEGMLFAYGETQQLCFWMRGMRFSLDMLWLDQDRRVSHIQPSISPATYPKSYCFDGQFVLELNAGQAARNHIVQGAQVTF